MTTDAFGNELDVGDRIVTTQNSNEMMFGIIDKVTEKQVGFNGWTPDQKKRHFYTSTARVVKIGEQYSIWMFPEYKLKEDTDG